MQLPAFSSSLRSPRFRPSRRRSVKALKP
jgi:hypothetical protein